MINFYDLDFTNKIVLEIGTGRGGTTLELGKVLRSFKGAKLITTDVYDGNFQKIEGHLKEYDIDVTFVKTDACELKNIEENSVDFIVCNYTLCAINSENGSAVIALNRFKEVLKSNGMLYIEEEYPLNIIDNSMQQVWSRKWQLLRAANMLLEELPYNEIKPEILEKVLYFQGFKNIQWNKESYKIIEEDCLEFFNYRFNKTLDRINNSQLVKGLREEGKELENFAKEAGGMEIPIYKMIAIK